MKRWYTRDWMEYKEENDKQADSRSPTRQIQDALENAVHRQLMSDVPYGVLLSGGLDSSVISAIAKKYAVTVDELCRYNHLERNSKLRKGQIIRYS